MLCSTDKVTFILGDFNLPDVDWIHYHATDNIIYNTFLNFVNSYGLTQFVDQPTHNNNILDLVLSSSNKIISDMYILPPIGASDHNVAMFDMNLVNSTSDFNSSDLIFFDWSHADYAMISKDLNAINWNCVFQYCFNVEECWSVFTEHLMQSVDKHVPVVQKRKQKAKQSIHHYGTQWGMI